PLEDPFAIRVEPAEREDGEEERHRADRPEPERAERERPREEEHGERVEDDEDQRDEVEADRELHPRLSDGLGAALVVLELGRVWPSGAEDHGHAERDHREGHDQAEVDDNRQIPGHGMPPWQATNPAEYSTRIGARSLRFAAAEPLDFRIPRRAEKSTSPSVWHGASAETKLLVTGWGRLVRGLGDHSARARRRRAPDERRCDTRRRSLPAPPRARARHRDGVRGHGRGRPRGLSPWQPDVLVPLAKRHPPRRGGGPLPRPRPRGHGRL